MELWVCPDVKQHGPASVCSTADLLKRSPTLGRNFGFKKRNQTFQPTPCAPEQQVRAEHLIWSQH